MVLNNLFTGQQWRNSNGEQPYRHGERGGEGVIYGKSNMETYITLCKIDSQQEFAIWFSSVQSCPTLSDPMNHSTPVHHQFLEFTHTHVHRVSDVIQPRYPHPLLSPSPTAPNPFQHQRLFQ